MCRSAIRNSRTLCAATCADRASNKTTCAICAVWQANNWTGRSPTPSATRPTDAFDAAQLLAGNPQRFLALLSPAKYGVGKTRLLACIVNAARAAGHTAIYTTTADVLDYLRSAYAPNAEVSYDGRFDTLRKARVLALDEFDRWAPTAWAQEKFFQLIDYRYRNADNLLTVFAANSDISILPGYIASRMNDVSNYVFVMTGQDVRRVRRN